MKKILILGGLGFIGSSLANRSLALGKKVTVYDNYYPNSGCNLFNVHSFKKDIEIIKGDITNYKLLLKTIKDKDIVINCAANTSHIVSMNEPLSNFKINCHGVMNILEAIKYSNKNIRLIQIGTTTQIGPLKYQPADELHPEFPLDIDSAHKTLAEKYVFLYVNAYGLNATTIRLSNVYGPRAAIHNAEFTFNNYFIGQALKNDTITVYKPGTQLRNLIYIDDAVNAILEIAEKFKCVRPNLFCC